MRYLQVRTLWRFGINYNLTQPKSPEEESLNEILSTLSWPVGTSMGNGLS